jgi:hypothetical protein
MSKRKAKTKEPIKVIPIKEVAKAAPITTLLARPKPLKHDHYLLQPLVTLWKRELITSAELDEAYLDLDKATALVARVGIPQTKFA